VRTSHSRMASGSKTSALAWGIFTEASSDSSFEKLPAEALRPWFQFPAARSRVLESLAF
jgi:hypothetical protein